MTTTKPSLPTPTRPPVPTLFSRLITSVTAPAQATCGLTSSHTTFAVQPPQNVTPAQPVAQESSAAVSATTTIVRIAVAYQIVLMTAYHQMIMQATIMVTDLPPALQLNDSEDLDLWPPLAPQLWEIAHSRSSS